MKRSLKNAATEELLEALSMRKGIEYIETDESELCEINITTAGAGKPGPEVIIRYVPPADGEEGGVIMRKDLLPEPVTPVGVNTDQHSGRGAPGPEPQIPPIPPKTNPVYNADLTKEEIMLLASLGVRNLTTGKTASIKHVAGVFAKLPQKIREQAIEASHENKDSIELSRNAKGEYAYKIKVYLDAWKAPVAGIALIESMNKEMLTRYTRAPGVIEK